MSEVFECKPEHARKFRQWIEGRGGLLVWESANLSNPGATWTTPARSEEGAPFEGKPTWQAKSVPARHITDLDEVVVVESRVQRRVKIAIKRRGLSLVLTDRASKRVKDAVAAAGEGAWFEFGHDEHGRKEAVIYVPGERIPLREFTA